MRLLNDTPWPALLQQADFGGPERFAVVIVKATYRREPDGSLSLAEDSMPISGELIETPFGMFHGDIFLRKRGVDLAVLGTLRRSRPATEAQLTLRVGTFEHSLRVLGDRTWQTVPGSDALLPSTPTAFSEMDISYRRAYGGAAQSEGFAAPFQDNPVGRGYYLSRDAAIGQFLPNIESGVVAPLSSWEEQRPPAGWGPYPMNWGLRARQAVTLDEQTGIITDISPGLFNNAHPDLVVPAVEPGTQICIEGMRDELWSMQLPRGAGHVRVQVGESSFDVPARVDGVFIWLDAARVVVTQRANFRYVFRERELRSARLFAAA